MPDLIIRFPDEESRARWLRRLADDPTAIWVDEDFHYQWEPVIDLAAGVVTFTPLPDVEDADPDGADTSQKGTP